jgi:hypothetical protein
MDGLTLTAGTTKEKDSQLDPVTSSTSPFSITQAETPPVDRFWADYNIAVALNTNVNELE